MESSFAAARSRESLFGAPFACSGWDGEGVDWRSDAGPLRHRILAEICEQPDAVARTIAGRTQNARAILLEAGLTLERIAPLRRVVIVATERIGDGARKTGLLSGLSS